MCRWELQFYIRGVDYQPGGSSDLADPLANTTTCSRDIPLMKELGLNAVRVCMFSPHCVRNSD